MVPNEGFCMDKADDYRLTQTIERKFFSYEVKEAPKLLCPGIKSGSVPFIISGVNQYYTTTSRAFRYPSDGYTVTLPSPNAVNALQDVKQIKDNLEKCHFVDLHTRFIVFELVTINPSQEDTVLLVELHVEFDTNGVVYPGYMIKQALLFNDNTFTRGLKVLILMFCI